MALIETKYNVGDEVYFAKKTGEKEITVSGPWRVTRIVLDTAAFDGTNWNKTPYNYDVGMQYLKAECVLYPTYKEAETAMRKLMNPQKSE